MGLFSRKTIWALLCLAQTAQADDRLQGRLLEPDAPAPSPPSKTSEAAKGFRIYYIQVGAFPTLRQASYLRSVIQNLGPSRVEKTGQTYRVLLGQFGDAEKAEAFIQETRLRTLFPALWVDILTSDIADGPGNGVTEVPLTEQEKDTRTINVGLYCGSEGPKAERRGSYLAQFTPDPGQADATPSMEIKWSCINSAQVLDDWAQKNRERNPSYLGVAPLIAMGSLSQSGGALGELGLSHFSYGLQLSAFKSLGGIGPVLEYRLINARYSGGSGTPTPIFDLQQSAMAGVRLPFAHRFEAEPLAGFVTQSFLQGTTLGDASFKSIWTPHISGRLRLRVIEFTDRASLDLSGGFGYFVPATNSEIDGASGSVVTGQFRLRHFSNEGWGSDWFVEYNSYVRSSNGATQGESMLRIGVSFLLELK